MSDKGEDNPPNKTTGETVIEGTGGLCEGGHTGDTVRWLGFATITGEVILGIGHLGVPRVIMRKGPWQK